MPTNPIAPTTAPETPVAIAPALDVALLAAPLAPLAMLESLVDAPLTILDPLPDAVLTATLKIDVTPEITSVVRDEYVLPAPLPDPDDDPDVGVAVVVLLNPVVAVVVTVEFCKTVVSLEVMVEPAESVVVTTTTTADPPDEEVARRALISDSRAAIWVDQALGTAEANHAGTLVASKASYKSDFASPVTDAAPAAELTADSKAGSAVEGMYWEINWSAADVNWAASVA